MDAPKCKICKKRHYGMCAGEADKLELKPEPEKKIVASRSATSVETVHGSWHGHVEELVARVESLEARVEELESRKRYMRNYQRDRRAKENDDG